MTKLPLSSEQNVQRTLDPVAEKPPYIAACPRCDDELTCSYCEHTEWLEANPDWKPQVTTKPPKSWWLDEFVFLAIGIGGVLIPAALFWIWAAYRLWKRFT